MSSTWLKWREGRQHSGYSKLLLLTGRFPLPFDVYLLKFEKNSCVPVHRDQVAVGRHYRLNMILKHARVGGVFSCQEAILNWSRIKLFRPDLCKHSVSTVEDGTRLVLSIGWIRKARKVPEHTEAV